MTEPTTYGTHLFLTGLSTQHARQREETPEALLRRLLAHQLHDLESHADALQAKLGDDERDVIAELASFCHNAASVAASVYGHTQRL